MADGESLDDIQKDIAADIHDIRKNTGKAKLSQGSDGKITLDVNVNESGSEDKKTIKEIAKGMAKSGAKGGLKLGAAAGVHVITGSPVAFLIGTLIIHLFFAIQGFPGGNRMYFSYFVIYIGVGILYVFASGEGRWKSILTWAFAAAVMYAAPGLARDMLSSPEAQGVIYYIAAFIPIWPLMMLQRLAQESPDGWGKVFKFYKVVGIALPFTIILISLLFSVGLKNMPDNAIPGVNSGEQLGNFFDTFLKAFTNIQEGITDSINQTLNPGSYYTGQVEQNSQGEMGVKFTDLRPIDRTITEDMELFVYGTVQANTFLDNADTLPVVPACNIDRRSVTEEAGVDPEIMDILLGTESQFTCRFGTLERGAYTINAYATFPFQTWAYITYTFVDDERARNIARQGLDIRKELEIDREAQAIFTSGPLKIGMGGTPQPIRLDPGEENPVPAGTFIGLTLDPSWGKGEVDRIERIELKAPWPFELYECDRCEAYPEFCLNEPDPFEELYTNYVFENPTNGPVAGYTSITCKLGVVEGADLYPLLSEADKALRSFIGVAYYTYTVEGKTTVNVR